MGRPKLDRSKVCPRCGKEFRPKDWRNTFCSRSCAYTKDLPTKTCAHCGREFRKNREYSYEVWATIRHCSTTCRGMARRRERVCVYCGANFTGKNGRRNQPYCTRACYWLSLRTERYPVDRRPRREHEFSHRQRRELLERASHRCEWCGATEALEADHVVPVWNDGTNDLANGQILCRPCHRRKTSQDVQSYWESSGEFPT